jgi:hypothetical protein
MAAMVWAGGAAALLAWPWQLVYTAAAAAVLALVILVRP